MPITARLVDATSGAELVLSTTSGYVVQQFDPGAPDVREVASNAPNADGEIDTTLLIGGRNITARLKLWGEPVGLTVDELGEALRGWMHPSRRAYLHWSKDGHPERRALVRAQPWQGNHDFTSEEPFPETTVQWRAPRGIWESADEHLAIAFASAAGAELGRTYNLTFNRTYSASPVLGSVQVINDGTADAWPLIRIYGACTEPNIEDQTTGKKLELNSLTLAADEFLEIDTRAKTVRLNGLSSASRYDKVDFATSSPGLDLRIIPGINLFRFYPATAGVTAKAEITWRHSYL